MNFDQLLYRAITEDNVLFVTQTPTSKLRQLLVAHTQAITPLGYSAINGSVNCAKYMMSVLSADDINAEYQEPGPEGVKFTALGETLFRILKDMMEKKTVVDRRVECARLLVRDHRTNVMFWLNSVVLAGLRIPGYFILGALFSTIMRRAVAYGPGHALLLDMVRNPSVDINQTVFYYDRQLTGLTTESILMTTVREGGEELFNVIVDHKDIDLSFVCTPRRQNALHYAVKRNVEFAIVKLLDVMSPESIHLVCATGETPFDMAICLFHVHPHIVHLFMRADKFHFDSMAASTVDSMRNMPPIVRVRFRAYVDAHPRSSILSKLYESLDVDSTFIGLLARVIIVDDRMIRATIDEHGCMIKSILHAAIGKLNLGVHVFETMLTMADLRDEISRPMARTWQTSVEKTIILGRHKILQLLLRSTTDNLFVSRKKNKMSPLQLAQRLNAVDCVAVIQEMNAEGNSKITPMERGHLFDCC